MSTIKEVTVFTNGDSNEISTWSNVPFFFTTSLEKKGIKVNRVNFKSNSLFARLFDSFMWHFCKKFTTYTYLHSYTNFVLTRRLIRQRVKRYPNSDADIFLSFSFSSVGLTNKPIVQFCDWTYDHYIRHREKRKPDFLERKAIEREDSQINGADMVVCLFPGVATYMQQRYGKERVVYLGNVINSLYEVSEDSVCLKKKAKKLLFVGNHEYVEGAKSLIAAFALLKQDYPELTLHIIGMEQTTFDCLPEDVFCYGYLDKGVDAHRDLYYQLVREATIFINTTPQWGAFSASIEAMYFYTPVIVSPYAEFVETFGSPIDFGCYCEDNSPALIERSARTVLEHSNYQKLCVRAHEAVKDFTWDAYVDKFIAKIEI
ncbi:hypothetical protein FACS1894162_0900 [Bacteroidia bacterium]|nr:hypothetical protein FACS1894162_0900 [Bacteroidia bacterium]